VTCPAGDSCTGAEFPGHPKHPAVIPEERIEADNEAARRKTEAIMRLNAENIRLKKENALLHEGVTKVRVLMDKLQANREKLDDAFRDLREDVERKEGMLKRLINEKTDREKQYAEVCGAYQIASESADRFRDLCMELLDLEVNPGDDALVAHLRIRHSKTGPESTRWREDTADFKAQAIDSLKPGGHDGAN